MIRGVFEGASKENPPKGKQNIDILLKANLVLKMFFNFLNRNCPKLSVACNVCHRSNVRLAPVSKWYHAID